MERRQHISSTASVLLKGILTRAYSGKGFVHLRTWTFFVLEFKCTCVVDKRLHQLHGGVIFSDQYRRIISQLAHLYGLSMLDCIFRFDRWLDACRGDEFLKSTFHSLRLCNGKWSDEYHPSIRFKLRIVKNFTVYRLASLFDIGRQDQIFNVGVVVVALTGCVLRVLKAVLLWQDMQMDREIFNWPVGIYTSS